MAANSNPEPVPDVPTRKWRILSLVVLLLVVSAVLFAPQILDLTSQRTVVLGQGEDADEEKEGEYWPGMWLFDRSGKLSIHIYSNGHRASGAGGLVGCLKHEDEGIRKSAANWLKAIGPAAKDALPALRETLSDPDDGVRAAAEAAIKRIEKKRPANRP
jgi:hypothetical protein